jgi:hypothetical protein
VRADRHCLPVAWTCIRQAEKPMAILTWEGSIARSGLAVAVPRLGGFHVVGWEAFFFLALNFPEALSFLLSLASAFGFCGSEARFTLGLCSFLPTNGLAGGNNEGGLSGCNKA